MASSPSLIQYFYRYRQWVNCQGGGYLEDYNLAQAPASATSYPTNAVMNAVKSILCLRGQLLEGNSKIASGEISIETLPGVNPPEGFQVPHGISGSVPVVTNDPTTGTIETQIGTAIDVQQAIGYRLDTQAGVTELRTLRSLKASWVNQWGTLYPQINTKLAQWGSALPTAGTLITSFPTDNGTTTNPATMIAYFMLVVLVNTRPIQLLKSGGYVYNFATNVWATPNSVNSPSVVNPVVQSVLTRRKIGEGWPKIHGKMQSFGTHG